MTSPPLLSCVALNGLQLLQQFLNGEARATRASHEFADQLIQPALPLGIIARYFLVTDERARALLGLQQTSNFQLAISSNNCVRINRQVHRELANRRKLIAPGQCTRGHAADHLVDDLPVNRDAAVHIQPALTWYSAIGSNGHLNV